MLSTYAVPDEVPTSPATNVAQRVDHQSLAQTERLSSFVGQFAPRARRR